MTGSSYHYQQLAKRYAIYLLSEAEFDARFTPATAAVADIAWLSTVKAAVAADPNCLRSPSIKDWIERRLRSASPFLGIPTTQGRTG